MSPGPPAQKRSGAGVSRRRVLQTVAAGAGASLLVDSSLASHSTRIDRQAVQDVQAVRDRQVAQLYDDTDVLREDVWVETETDTDSSGELDRVHVEIVRPAESDEDGNEVPVVLRPDPYRFPQPGGLSPGDSIPGDPDLGEVDETMEVELYYPGRDAADSADSSNDTEDDTGGQTDRILHRGGQTDRLHRGGQTDRLHRGGQTDRLHRGGQTDRLHTGGGTEHRPHSPGPSPGQSTYLTASLQQDEQFFYERTLVAEGYAFAYVAPVGSSLSTGCNTLGGPTEVASVRAAIDWFNGRATAYDSREGGETVEATWTTGSTGLFGESYRGALANGVATLGVDGLETVVSIRAISSWYTYVRSNGAVIVPGDEGTSRGGNVAILSAMVTTREDSERCHGVIADTAEQVARETGNYTDFWAERDYVRDAGNVEASVFLVHGLYDQQVRPTDFARWLDALKAHDVPYNVWLHQGGHDDPRERHETPWLDRLVSWYDYWLRGEENGVMDEPPVTVERKEGSLVEQDDWPHPDTRRTTVRFEPGGEATGGLGLDGPDESVTESLVDNSDVEPAAFFDDGHADHRLFYRTPVLEEPVHVSGRIRPQLELSFDSPAALVSAALVDYRPNGPTIVNRGWMNPLNRNSLEESEAIEPGESYRIEFPMEPVDYVFEEGHRLGILLYSSDHNVTKRPPSSPELTLSLRESSLDVPIVGGEDVLYAAVTGESRPDENGEDENGEHNGEDENGDGSEDENGNGDTTGEAGEADDADDDGPGLGIVSGLAGLGGVGYLLKRRLDRSRGR